ncbi:MAG: protein-glutamate O-methyltransferase CheR [Proteobacteria bacterium]|nr:protein-glutamate O-methyltransferase CheR [Pseudomonadota bacterium]
MIKGAKSAANKLTKGFQLDDTQYLKLTDLIEKRTGLSFSPEKQREFQFKLQDSFRSNDILNGIELINAVRESDEVLQNVVNCLTIGESYFFRNKPHFEALTEQILPQLIRNAKTKKRLRIWSAGCATGEEPYSLAILIHEHFPELADWNISILGTDINTGFLERAQEGIYKKWSFRGVDENLIWKYFQEEGDNRYRLHADIKRAVKFKRFNLAETPFAGRLPNTEYDLILCRNVLIYFSFKFANRVVAALGDITHPGSYLLVGHSEAFPALSQLDVIYSNATYYYRCHRIPGEKADQQSIAPGPTLSIPGIGVKTIVPKSPVPEPVIGYKFLSKTSSTLLKPRSKSGILRKAKKIDITGELEQLRRDVNEGKINETLERLSALANGPGKLDYRVHFLRSIVGDQAGKTKESITSLKQAIFLKKDFVIGHFFLGVLYQREGRNKMSAKSFRNARGLVAKLPNDHLLDEAEGLTAGRLEEIVQARLEEVRLEQ